VADVVLESEMAHRCWADAGAGVLNSRPDDLILISPFATDGLPEEYAATTWGSMRWAAG
jgi:hypothetical protein